MTASRAQVEKLGFCEHAENILWSYDDAEFSFRTSPQQVYLEYPVSNCQKQPGSLYEESLRAAKMIGDRHQRPVILLSGGVDSEMTLLSFHLQKIPVEVVILDYLGLNEHDIYRAKNLCQKLGVSYRVKTFDLFHFWENDLEALAKKVNCSSPQVAALCQAVGQVDGYVVIGDGDSSLRGRSLRFFESKIEVWALARWMLLHEREGCPRFFQYTKGLEASWYFEPLVEQFVGGSWEFFDFNNLIYLKPFIAHKHFNSELRAKLTGFENITACEDYRHQLIQMLPPLCDISWTYENARKWAVEDKPHLKCIDLEESDLTTLEKNHFRQAGTKRNLIWTDAI